MGKKSRANRRAQQLGHRTTNEPLATNKALHVATDDGTSLSVSESQQVQTESSPAEQDREEATRSADAEVKAQNLVENAQQEAQRILARAEAEAEQTRADANAARDALLTAAETTIKEQLAMREAELVQQHREKGAQLKTREEEVATNETNLKRREAELKIRQEDFEFEQETLALQRDELRKRWATCSPDRLWELEQQLETRKVTAERMAETITKLQQEVRRLRDAETSSGGRPLSALVTDLEQSESRVRELSDKLASLPSERELLTMRQDASEVEILREQNSELHRRVASADERALRLELGLREIEQVRVESEALRILNDELRNELSQNAEALTQRSGKCFPN